MALNDLTCLVGAARQDIRTSQFLHDLHQKLRHSTAVSQEGFQFLKQKMSGVYDQNKKFSVQKLMSSQVSVNKLFF